MARPKKCRKVCSMPSNTGFAPSILGICCPTVTMTVDEYETIRLIDLEEMTQGECAGKMDIARTTVQSIYISARKKLADCLVNGKMLKIEGGDFRVCGGNDLACKGSKCCQKNDED
jgi:Predicted DNA-binding proteins